MSDLIMFLLAELVLFGCGYLTGIATAELRRKR
jgi:hypothetical protein